MSADLMDAPSQTSRLSRPEPAGGRGFVVGVTLHLSLWLLLAAGLLAWQRHVFFPRHPLLVKGLVGVLVAVAVCLWLPGRFRAAALMTVNILSLSALALVATEAYMGSAAPEQIDLMRYPYPHRMHGFAPFAKAADNRYNASSNDTGLREPAPIGRKQPGEFRVVVLGGSAIFGVGAADDETIPVHLEKLLTEHQRRSPLAGISKIRVINAGQGWYNSTNEWAFLTTELVLYEPDLLLVIDGYNDAHHAMVWDVRPPANAPTAGMVSAMVHAPGCFREGAWDSALYLAVQTSKICQRLGIKGADVFAQPRLDLPAAPPTVDKGRGDFSHSMKHRLIMNWTLMDRLGKAFHCPVIFGLQPCLYAKPKPAASEKAFLDSQAYSGMMTRVWADLETYAAAQAQRLKLRYVQPDRHIRAVESALFTDYCHLTPAGNRLAAQAACEEIVAALQHWPWRADWDGIRYPFADGDPIWRPHATASQTAWE